jgi:small conductance mechanosensitive channel
MFEYFYAGLYNHFENILRVALIFVLWGVALRVIHRVIPRLREALVSRQTDGESGQRIRTLSRVVRYALTVAATVVAGLLMLGEFGISVAPLLGAAGVAGIAIGFGAQNLVKDYFTGFFLLLEDQIRIGDVVNVGDKGGLVEELTLRYLKLRDYSGNVHFIPNGSITTVTNMSMGFAYAVIDASIAYGEDIDQAISVMRCTGEEIRIDPVFADKLL